MATQPDERLAALVRDGNERAFELLVQRHRRALARYCRRFSLADARAEDVLQQAFLSAWIAMRAGAEVRDVKPWLYRIVHNTALNSLRAESSREPTTSIDAAQAASVELTALPGFAGSAGAEDVLLARDVLAGVAELPEMQREVIVRAALGGDSYEQVAGELGISDGAVRGLLHRARATLRAGIAGFVPPPLIAWTVRGLRRASTAGPHVGDVATGGGALAARSGVAALAAGIAIAGAAFAPSQHAHRARQASPISRAPAVDARAPIGRASPAANDARETRVAVGKRPAGIASGARAAATGRALAAADAGAQAHAGNRADVSTGALGAVPPQAGGERSSSTSTEPGAIGSAGAQGGGRQASTAGDDAAQSGAGAQSTGGEANVAAHPGKAPTTAQAQEATTAEDPTPLAAAEVTTSSGSLEAKVLTPVAGVEASMAPASGTISVAVTPSGTPEGAEAPVAVSVGGGGATVDAGPIKLTVGQPGGASEGGPASTLLADAGL